MRRPLAAVCLLALGVILLGAAAAAQTYAPIVVSGAGSPEVNGTYAYAGIVNGKPSYVNGDYSIEWFTNATSYWKLGLGGYVIDYYCNLAGTATPPSTGWQGGCGAVSSGVEPYPTTSGGEELTPEIDVRGNGATIPDGDSTPSLGDHTDFGTLSVSSSWVTRTFPIHNTGTGNLSIGTVSVSGSADFSVTAQPGASVAAGASTPFLVRFDPSADGLRTATVEIPNGDSDENPYTFAIQGTGDGTGPTVTNVTPNVTLIADANVGVGTFTIAVDFSEAMNTGVTPGLAFNPSVAATLSLSGTTWVDSDTFRATYTVSDAGVAVVGVTVDVTGAEDVYSNAQQNYEPQSEFNIDTQNPTVSNVVADTSPMYDGDLVQEITVTWSEAMNTSAGPAVVFSSGTWTPGAAGVWSSGNTVWVRSFTLTDANAAVANVTVDVTGAQDAVGNTQQDYTPQSEFGIDTLNPTATVAANDVAIYDGDVGADRFVVTATFSEAMNPAIVPSLVFLPGMATTFTNPSAAWGSGNTVYTWTYDVTDDGATVLDVDLMVSGGADVAGNTQIAAVRGDYVDVDLQNPTVAILANDVAIYDGDVGTDRFTVTATFSETMSPGVAPTLTFTPAVASTFTSPSGAWSVGNTVYTWTYDVADANIAVADVDVSVSGARDAAGNTQVANTNPGYVDIDTQNPTVAGVSSSDLLVADADAGGSLAVTVDFSEPMGAASVPTLVFAPSVVGTLTFSGGVWVDADTYQAAYTISDANTDADSVTVDVISAKDLAGNDQLNYAPQGELGIDTLNPTVIVAASDVAIYDGDVGADRFVVTATFSEAMNPAIVPSLVFLPGMATTFTNPSAAWGSGNTVYTWTYDVADDGATVLDVDLMVSGGADVSGNTQIAAVRADYVDVDLQNPTVVILANDVAIYDGDVGTDRFTVTATFSETMNPGVAPTLTFTPAVASTFTNPSGAWSVGNTVYTWTYDVADANITVADVDVSVSGARDVAGNTQVANTNPDDVDIDTQNPTVAGVSSSDLLVADADAGGSLVVTVDFSELMGATSIPTLVFAPSVVGTLTFSGGVWVDADTYQATYTVSDANTDADSVTVDVISAKDLAGNDQLNYAPQGEFGIDTLNPAATNVVASDLLIADSDAGLTRYVTVDFTEPMDPAAVPVFTFAPDVASTLTLSGGVWQTTVRYRASYVAADANVDVNSVTVDVTTARDAAGNAQQDYTPQHELEIDTLNPTVVGILLSDLLITDADVGGTFSVTIDYSEPMLSGTPPTVTFVPGLATTLSFLGSSGWLDADTYVARYTVLDGGVTVNDDDVQTSLGRDLAGNVQIPYNHPDQLDVDTENPIISAFVVTGGQVGSKAGNDCVREVTWNATVTDPNGCMDPDDIVITTATVRTGNASITAPYAVTRTAVSPTVAVIAGTVDVYDLTGCPAVPRIVLDATDCVGNSAVQAREEGEVYDAIVPTINDLTFNIDGTYATPTDEYEVDPCCVTTVYFSANVTDNCCISSGNIGVSVTLPTANAVLESISWQSTQDGQKRVEVTGHADVRCLSSCYARVQVVVMAYDCCGNDAATVTSPANEGLVWDRLPPEPADDPNGYEPKRCDGLEVRRDDFGQFRLMIRESTPTYVDALCNDTDNCSVCTCCGTLWIYDIVDQPEFGTATVVDDVGDCRGGTSIRYAPNRGYLGPDRFTYRIIDACGNVSKTSTVYLQTIREVDLADVFAVACSGETEEIDIAATDLWIDPADPSRIPFRFDVALGPEHGVLAFDPSAVSYEPPSTVTAGGVPIPTLTFMESATLSLFYTAADDYVGRDAIRIGFVDAFGGRVVANVDIEVQDCTGSGTQSPRAAQGGSFVIIPPVSFGEVAQDLSSAVLLMSLDDGVLYPEGVDLEWSVTMQRFFLVVDASKVPPGRYYMRLSLGNGEVAELEVEVGESE